MNQPRSSGRRMRFPFVRLVRWNSRQRSQRYGMSERPERRIAASASSVETNRAFFMHMLSLVRIAAFLPPNRRFRQARLCAWSGRSLERVRPRSKHSRIFEPRFPSRWLSSQLENALGSAPMSKLPHRMVLDLEFGATDSMAPFAWPAEAEVVPLLRPSGAHRSPWSAPASARGAQGFAAPGATILAWAG